ncbi:uncharacterized protein LOC124272430 [Haliotis rubra]|uniref:uncharacterized protein LOC124272430 n=1 Tax=Haliotis rubra TaxID=36100 RepID=UPI001EE60EBF|nr:uncharacterized protein LOC124272430 [Haliotis rubra]
MFTIYTATGLCQHLGLPTLFRRGVLSCSYLRQFSTDGSPEQSDDAISGLLSRRFMASLKNMGYSQTVDTTETQSIVHTPGFSLESLDRDGNPTMPSLMRFVTIARIFASHCPLDVSGRTLFDYAELTSDRLAFAASSEFVTERELYDISVPKNPLDVLYQLGYVGKSSFSSVGSIIVPSTGQTILKNINHLVGMDKTSRRPKPLPDWWREKHGGSAILKNPMIVPKLERPGGAVLYNVKVAWVHTDNHNHTNYAYYAYYCVNALHYAIEKGCMGAVTKGVVKRGIKSMRNTYIGESLENDELTIWVWASDQDDKTVHFDIQKLGQSIFQSTFVYHD